MLVRVRVSVSASASASTSASVRETESESVSALFMRVSVRGFYGGNKRNGGILHMQV